MDLVLIFGTRLLLSRRKDPTLDTVEGGRIHFLFGPRTKRDSLDPRETISSSYRKWID